MICQRCGTEIDTRYTYPDGSVQCPGCGLIYRPTYAPQQQIQSAPEQSSQEPAAPRRRRSAQYADNQQTQTQPQQQPRTEQPTQRQSQYDEPRVEPQRNIPPVSYPPRFDDEPPKKKSSKKWLIILAAVLGALVIAFLGIRLFSRSKQASGKMITAADTSGVKIEQLSAADVVQDTDSLIKFAKGELVYVAKDGVTFEQVDEYFRSINAYDNGGELVGYDKTLGLYVLRMPYGESYYELANEAEMTLGYTDLFEDIFPNYVFDIDDNSVNDQEWQPWDSKKEQHWGWDAIYMNEALARLEGVKLTDVDVGIIDNQFYGHEDINIWDAYYNGDFDSSLKSPAHGTHVAGIIGAGNNNNLGIAGITDRIRLHCFSMRGFSASGEADGGSFAISGWLTGIGQLVEKNNCKVINISQGFLWIKRSEAKNSDGSPMNAEEFERMQREVNEECRPHVETVLRMLLKKHDFLIVVSAGNSNNNKEAIGDADFNSIFTYAKSEDIRSHILVVGSASKAKDGTIYVSDYSSYGDRVDVIAPGEHIYSTVPKKDVFMSILTGTNIYNSGYEYMSGTSMAAPCMTGVAALVWNINPNFTSAQVRDFIERGHEAYYGYRSGQWFTRENTYPFIDAEHVVTNAMLEIGIEGKRDNTEDVVSASELDKEEGKQNNDDRIIVLKSHIKNPSGDDAYISLVELDLIDLKTGQSEPFRKFWTTGYTDANIAIGAHQRRVLLNPYMFNDDYTRVSAFVRISSNDAFLGYLNQKDEFSHFPGNPVSSQPASFDNGYWYYIEQADRNIIKRVSDDSHHSVDSETIGETTSSGYMYIPLFDFENGVRYSDTTKQFAIPLGELSNMVMFSWLSQSECIAGDYSGNIYRYTINNDRENWCQKKEFVMSLSDTIINGIFSADGKRLTYIHCDLDESFSPINPGLRIASLEDGAVTEIKTDYSFDFIIGDNSLNKGEAISTYILGWDNK